MDSYTSPTPVSPNSRSVTANSSPYTTYTRHHRKRISALRLSSDTTSTLPEYIPTNPNIPSVAHWRTVPEATEIDDAPPGYSSDSAQEADEDTDLSDEDRRRQIQRSVFATVGIHSAPATATTFTSSPSLRASRPKRELSHRRKRSNPTLSLDPIQSNSDLYLDSLLERSVHALEMSNVLLQSSMSTKTSLSGILHQETDEDEPMVPSSAMRPSTSRSVAGSGMNSLERSARGLSARIMGGGYVHETWIEDLEQIGKDVDQLFSEEAQKERRQRNRTRRNDSQSGSSQGSISSSLPVVSSTPIQLYNKFDRDRIAHSSGTSPQQHSNHANRRTLVDLRSHSQMRSFSNPNRPEHSESLERHDVMAGVPQLRYDVQDRERFISQPPRALTQYIVVKGDLTHGHEEENSFQHHQHHRRNSSRGYNGDGNDNSSDNGGREGPLGKETELRENDEDEFIVLPSTLGLRSLGTHSTIRRNKQLLSSSRSPSPERSVSRFVHHHDDQLSTPVTISTPTIVLDPSSSLPSHSSLPTRAPNAYNMLSSFVYPASSSSSNLTPKRSDSSSSNSRPKGKTSPFASPWASRRSSVNSTVAERPSFGATSGTNGHEHFARRRHSTSPAASMMSNRTTCTTRSGGSGSSSTVTAGSGSRSRSQTPKPLESGPILTSSGRRHMTPPLEVSSNSGSGGEGNCSERREGSEASSDSCPTKQTILSLRKILDTHSPPEKLSSDDWTLISKPPLLLQQSSKVGVPVEAGTSNATASISKLFTRGVHSHEGSVTRRYDEQRQSSFKGKAKATSTDSAASSAPSTPITTSRVPTLTPNKMSFDNIPKLLGTSVALALGASSPLSSTPSSGASTPATPSHLKRISFAELPEGTQGTGSNRKSRKRKGKQKASSSRLSNGGASYRKQSGSDDDEGDEPRGWLRWLINAAGVDSGRPDKIDERLGKGWGSASRGPGYGGMDEWGI
ncbi:hypothetical protein F5051DRAFT_1004 [Lentinula edodes]|nr:hypothetical protein F5051DRAFT_1004 [Lentinula edodes]